jgi:arginase
MQRLNAANVSSALLEKGQSRVIDASLTLIRERAKLKVSHYLVLFCLSKSVFLWCFVL